MKLMKGNEYSETVSFDEFNAIKETKRERSDVTKRMNGATLFLHFTPIQRVEIEWRVKLNESEGGMKGQRNQSISIQFGD